MTASLAPQYRHLNPISNTSNHNRLARSWALAAVSNTACGQASVLPLSQAFGCWGAGGTHHPGPGNHKEPKIKLNTVDLSNPNLSIPQKLLLAPIWLYQRLTRKKENAGGVGRTFLGRMISASCPYSPSCSEYTAECITKYGAVKGLMKGIWRVVFMCNPIYFWIKGINNSKPRSIPHPA